MMDNMYFFVCCECYGSKFKWNIVIINKYDRIREFFKW